MSKRISIQIFLPAKRVRVSLDPKADLSLYLQLCKTVLDNEGYYTLHKIVSPAAFLFCPIYLKYRGGTPKPIKTLSDIREFLAENKLEV